MGEANSPGSIDVPANTTLNQALLSAGGFNRRARRTRSTHPHQPQRQLDAAPHRSGF
ncbi:MAG: hypothetical protein HC895_15095 [Leptolyngbyaceae cyanobacterium SM1_3_5]|nr:hypothetical protein [Leptolyngbyaceae cyanobacterium SM1_3_5]